MQKFEEIDNNHKTAAKAEKLKFAIQTLNRLDGPKINKETGDDTSLEVVRIHLHNTIKEIAELQERIEILTFLDKHFIFKMQPFLKEF